MSRFFPRAALFAAVLSAVSPVAFAGLFSDPDKNWQEGEYALPPAPREENLHEFYVTASTPNTFLVDTASLDVGDDGVVRYVLVIRTSGGAENVSFEGIRCSTGESRIYAHGRSDGEWAPSRRSEWVPLRATSYNMPRAVLAVQHFCDGPAPPRSREHALYGLREGIR